MEPVHVVGTILGLGLIVGGSVVARSFLQSRRDTRLEELRQKAEAKKSDDALAERLKLLEAQSFASSQETERMKILSEAISKNKALADYDKATEGERG